MRDPKTSTDSSRARSHQGFSRRGFLRGLGSCVALPVFESLRRSGLFAAEAPAIPFASTAGGAPLRTAFIYFPNGAIPSAWWPQGEGKAFDLGRTLKPLEAVRAHLQVLGGLDH